jgi:hypothetical protein
MGANPQNLVNFTSDQDREAAVRNGRKGGIASGEAKRRRKSLREQLEILLENGNTQESVAVALIEKAMGGDVKAFEVLRDTVGEKPVDKVETKQTVVDMSKFTTEEIKAMLDDEV